MKKRKIVGHISPDRARVTMPSSWAAEAFKPLSSWPQFIYAGRVHTSGHRVPLVSLPEVRGIGGLHLFINRYGNGRV